MIIVKGDLGVAINPQGLQIVYEEEGEEFIPVYKSFSEYNDIDAKKNTGYYIKAVYTEFDSVVLTSRIKTIEEAGKLLDELYKGLQK